MDARRHSGGTPSPRGSGNLADRISLGELEAPDVQVRSRDEIRTLAESLARLRKSMAQAMKMLES